MSETFNDSETYETSYFDFYDDYLMIYGFPPNLPRNRESFNQFILLLWNAFPDTRIMFDDIIIKENKVACLFTLLGTYKGKFLRMSPTNKAFREVVRPSFTFRITNVFSVGIR